MQGVNYQLSDYISDVRTLIHDPSASDYTDAELTPIINKARNQAAMDCRCVRQMITGLSTVTQQEQYPLTNFVGGLSIVSGGKNYSDSPTITVAGGGTGTAVVQNGVIVYAYMNAWLNGVLSTPAVTITDPTGSGAVLAAVNPTNILDLYLVTGLPTGQAIPATLSNTFNWLPFDAFQAFCRAYRAYYGWPGAYTVHYGPINPLATQSSTNPAITNTQRVYLFPMPNQVQPMEWDALTMPAPLANDTDIDYWVLQPFTDAVQYYAAYTALLGLQNPLWPQMLNLYDRRKRELSATARARRVHNFYYTYKKLMRRM